MIRINNFSSIEIDGVNVGDCFAAYANYPDQAGAILAAIASYEQALIAAAVPAPETPTIDPAQITELQQQLSEAQQTIAQQQSQLSQLVIADWPGLISELKTAGFYAWLAAAANADPDLLDEVSRLSAAANAANRDGVIREYVSIYQKYPPTTEQLAAWQAVLDDRGIPSNLLAFVPLG